MTGPNATALPQTVCFSPFLGVVFRDCATVGGSARRDLCSPSGVLFRDCATPGVVEVWPVRFSPFWGEYRRRRGGGLGLCSPHGPIAPSVSLPIVGCHLPQEGRKRATYSQVSQLGTTVHQEGGVPPVGRGGGSGRGRDHGLTPSDFGLRPQPPPLRGRQLVLSREGGRTRSREVSCPRRGTVGQSTSQTHPACAPVSLGPRCMRIRRHWGATPSASIQRWPSCSGNQPARSSLHVKLPTWRSYPMWGSSNW